MRSLRFLMDASFNSAWIFFLDVGLQSPSDGDSPLGWALPLVCGLDGGDGVFIVLCLMQNLVSEILIHWMHPALESTSIIGWSTGDVGREPFEAAVYDAF